MTKGCYGTSREFTVDADNREWILINGENQIGKRNQNSYCKIIFPIEMVLQKGFGTICIEGNFVSSGQCTIRYPVERISTSLDESVSNLSEI